MKKRFVAGIDIQRSSGNILVKHGRSDAEKRKSRFGLVIPIAARVAAQPLGHLTLATA